MKPAAIALLYLTGSLLAQPPDARLTFEAASVRPSGPRSYSAEEAAAEAPAGQLGGPGTADPGKIFYSRVTLQRLIMNAYGVQRDQIVGPAWLAGEKYDITADVPSGATGPQVSVMLQNLLMERFGLKLHHLTKDGPAYDLKIAKGGAKLKEAAPELHTRVESARVNGLQHKSCGACTIAELIENVQGFDIGRLAPERIIDKTGLTGRYEFSLEYLSPAAAGQTLKLSALQSQSHAGMDIFKAMETQLGLTLEKARAPVDLLVIDHVEKTPSEN